MDCDAFVTEEVVGFELAGMGIYTHLFTELYKCFTLVSAVCMYSTLGRSLA